MPKGVSISNPANRIFCLYTPRNIWTPIFKTPGLYGKLHVSRQSCRSLAICLPHPHENSAPIRILPSTQKMQISPNLHDGSYFGSFSQPMLFLLVVFAGTLVGYCLSSRELCSTPKLSTLKARVCLQLWEFQSTSLTQKSGREPCLALSYDSRLQSNLAGFFCVLLKNGFAERSQKAYG